MSERAGKTRATSGPSDRYFVQKDKHPLFQKLSQGDNAPFRQIKDVWVLAAALGFKLGRRQEMRGGTQHVGFWQYLSSQEDVPLLQAIAVAETGDIKVLTDQGQVLRIAEEYANAGIDLLMADERGERGSTLRSVATAIVDAARVRPIAQGPGERRERVDTTELIARGESARVEFKESARWNKTTKQPAKEIEHASLKTVAGFMNAKGGTLVIGVADSGEVVGLKGDYKTVGGGSSGRDAFENWLTSQIGNELGLTTLTHVSVTFEQFDEKDVCRVEVEPCTEPVYVGKDAIFYVRANNTTRKMNAREANEYVAKHWG
ncbi:MAG: putative DNA binding domain-containing protein [Actinomycetota bacterium]